MRTSASRQFVFMLFQDLTLIGTIALAILARLYIPGPAYRFEFFVPMKMVGAAVLFMVLKFSFHYFEMYDISVHISLRSYIIGLLKALFATLIISRWWSTAFIIQLLSAAAF